MISNGGFQLQDHREKLHREILSKASYSKFTEKNYGTTDIIPRQFNQDQYIQPTKNYVFFPYEETVFNTSLIVVSYLILHYANNIDCKRNEMSMNDFFSDIFYGKHGLNNTCFQWKNTFEVIGGLLFLFGCSFNISCCLDILYNDEGKKVSQKILLKNIIIVYMFWNYFLQIFNAFSKTQTGFFIISYLLNGNFTKIFHFSYNMGLHHLLIFHCPIPWRSKEIFQNFRNLNQNL